MKHSYDSTGVAPLDGSFVALPEGDYDLAIIDYKEKETKKGSYPLVSVKCEVVDSLKHDGSKIFYNVTFLPPDMPGAGMAIHFLKTIGEPWEGKFDWDPDQWIGKRFRAHIVPDTYEGKPQNKIVRISA